MSPALGGGFFTTILNGKWVGSIQIWCPHTKKSRHRHTQDKDHMKTQGEDGRL